MRHEIRLRLPDYCQCTIAWLKQDSKSYIVAELCRHAIGPESLIHCKLGPWQWQGESAFSVAIVY